MAFQKSGPTGTLDLPGLGLHGTLFFHPNTFHLFSTRGKCWFKICKNIHRNRRRRKYDTKKDAVTKRLVRIFFATHEDVICTLDCRVSSKRRSIVNVHREVVHKWRHVSFEIFDPLSSITVQYQCYNKIVKTYFKFRSLGYSFKISKIWIICRWIAVSNTSQLLGL